MKKYFAEPELRKRREQVLYELSMITGAFISGRYSEALNRIEALHVLIKETWWYDNGEDA
jgi:hypothetical protein